MIYCQKCGHGNLDGANFCDACGAPIVPIVPLPDGNSPRPAYNESLSQDETPARVNYGDAIKDFCKRHTLMVVLMTVLTTCFGVALIFIAPLQRAIEQSKIIKTWYIVIAICVSGALYYGIFSPYLFGQESAAGNDSTITENANDNENEDIVAKVGDAEITQGMVDRESALVYYSTYYVKLDSISPEEQTVFKNQTLLEILVPGELVKEHLKA
jgi:hypothetical protein